MRRPRPRERGVAKEEIENGRDGEIRGATEAALLLVETAGEAAERAAVERLRGFRERRDRRLTAGAFPQGGEDPGRLRSRCGRGLLSRGS